MNEILLVIVVIVLLLGFQLIFVRIIKKPLLHYIRILSAIALLILIWLFAKDSNIPVRIILSIIALSSVYKEFRSLKEFRSNL